MSFLRVIIHYGPIDTFCIPVHKKQKITVLRDQLRKFGYRVDVKAVTVSNLCLVEMCGHEVFRCNIRFLGFNCPYEQDPVCQKAVAAVLDASKKFLRSRSYLWCQKIIDDQMFSRSDYTPKDTFCSDVNTTKMDVMSCINCCGILVAKKTKDEIEQYNAIKRAKRTTKLTRPIKAVKSDRAKLRIRIQK